jgi:hypothetical protein
MNGGTDLSALGTVGLSHRLSHPSRRGGTRGPYRPLSRPTAAEPPVPAAAELRICPTAQSMAVGRGGRARFFDQASRLNSAPQSALREKSWFVTWSFRT